jgi:hypothetical protein
VKTVYNVDVGANKIFYTLENKTNAPIQQIAKKDVLMIKHLDGSKELFNTGDTSTPKTETPQNVPATASTAQIDRHPVVVKNEEFVPVKYIDEEKKTKGKTADYFYFTYQLKDGSIIGDENINAEYNIVGDDGSPCIKNIGLPENYSIQINLQNKTKNTIYIDLGKTFITLGSESYCYYIPTTTSNSSDVSNVGSVNLGSVGNALGLGNGATNLLNGVNVGGSSSKMSTTTTYSQRVIAIAPMSKINLEEKILFPLGYDSAYNSFVKTRRLSNTSFEAYIPNKYEEGKSIEFGETNSPINWTSFITYSFDESCLRTAYIQATLFVNQMIGLKRNFWSKPFMSEKQLNSTLSSDWKCKPFFCLQDF